MKKPKYPSPPRCMCTSWFKFILGVHSPSKELSLLLRGPQNDAERKYYNRIVKYRNELTQYKIHTRTMTGSEWKAYYRAVRIKERQEGGMT